MGQQLATPLVVSGDCSGNILKTVLLPGKNGRYGTMDNPLTLSLTHQDEIDLSWMGGLLDGEGSFNLHGKRDAQHNGKKGGRKISVQIRMGNTNPEILAEYIRLLNKYDIGHYIYKQQSRPWHKIATIVAVNRMISVYCLAKLIYPYVRAKRPHCYLVMNFLESRFKRASQGYNILYSDSELSWMDKLQEANRKGVRDCMSSTE